MESTMAEKKKKQSLTEKYAQKNKDKKKKTTAKDVPGSGMAKKAGNAMEAYHKKLSEI